jgi:Tol biopolymer transport system component
LDNVELALADNFYFNCGQMFIHNDVSVTGTSALVYCSCQPSFITSGAQLYFDVGTTFSVAPSTFTACPYTQNLYYGNQFIQMADATSTIIFNGSSFFTTSTGLRLTTGAVLFDNRVSLNSNASFTLASTSTSQATYINGINTGAQPNSVSWSPDGRFLAVCNLSGSNLQVFKFNGSSMPTQVGVNVSISTPPSSVSWSPDGRFIAVVSGGELVSEILSIFSFNGLNTPTPVGSVTIVAGETPNSVSWSPDGRFLAVASGSVTSGDGSLSMFSFNGVGNPSLVGSQSTAVSPFSVSWSPDGRFLAVVNSVTNTLQIFSFNGIGDPVQVTTGTGVATGGSSPISVTWSPDGRFLAFVNSTSNTLKIFSFSGSGNLILVGTANTATSSAASSSVTWSPDGRFLTVVFGSATTGALQIFSFRGSGNPTWFGTNISTGLDPFSVSWSPDERFLAVVNAIGHTLQIFGVNYIVNRTPPQALSNSIVFGNSSLGSSYDTTVDFLSGSNVILNGQINFDNVN